MSRKRRAAEPVELQMERRPSDENYPDARSELESGLRGQQEASAPTPPPVVPLDLTNRPEYVQVSRVHMILGHLAL